MEVVNDLQLRQIRQFRVTKGLPDAQFGRKLVAVNSTFGFAVIAGTDAQIYSVWTKTLEEMHSTNVGECDDFSRRTILFYIENAKIFALEFNSDGRVLAVVVDSPAGLFVYFFDAATFTPDYQQEPFPLNSTRLSDASAQATAFEWNPTNPEMFAIASTKTLSVVSFNIENHASIRIVGSKDFNVSIIAISWSPKGKQVTVGDNEGHVHQLKPEITLVRSVDPPRSIPSLGNGPYRCVGICWVSTTEWIVVFAGNASNSFHLCLLTVKKNQSPQWDNWAILPPTSSSTAPKAFNFLPVFNWNLILLSSSCLPEVPVIGAVNNIWKPWELTEPFLITTPMVDGKDTFVAGVSIDFTSTKPVVVAADGSSVAPSPIVYVYTSDGLLLLYHLVSLNPARPSLQKLIQGVSTLAVKNGVPPANYKPRALPENSRDKKVGIPDASVTEATPGSTDINSSSNKSVFSSEEIIRLFAGQIERQRKIETERVEQEHLREAAVAKAESEKKAAIARAEAEKKATLEIAAAKKQKDIDDAFRIFKSALDSVVAKLNEYSALTSKLSTLRRGLEIGIQEDLNFEQSIEPLFNSAAQVGVISTEIDDRLQRARTIVDAVNSSSKEARNLLSKGTELPAADWVFDLYDDLELLGQRHFETNRKYQDAERELQHLTKLLKEGKLHIQQPAMLTQDQQNFVNRDSLVISRYVNDLTRRLSTLRKKIRQLNSAESIRRTREALKKAGGINDSLLEQSSTFNISQSLNTSYSFAADTPELLSNLSLNASNQAIKPLLRVVLEPVRASKLAAVINGLESGSLVKPVKVKLVHIEDIAVNRLPEKKSLLPPTVNPKIVETRKALEDTLQTLRNPRKKLEPVSAQMAPRTLFNSNELLKSVFPSQQKPDLILPKPAVSPESVLESKNPQSTSSSLFDNGLALFEIKPDKPVVANKDETTVMPVKPVADETSSSVKTELAKAEPYLTPSKLPEGEVLKPIKTSTPENSEESTSMPKTPPTTSTYTDSGGTISTPDTTVSVIPTSTIETKLTTSLSTFSFTSQPAGEHNTETPAATPASGTETKPVTTPSSFFFKPHHVDAPAAVPTATTATTTTTTSSINFSFKPQQTTAGTQNTLAAPATSAFGQPAASEAAAINFSFKPTSPTSTTSTSAFGGNATTGSAFGGTSFGTKFAFGGATTPTTSAQTKFANTGTSTFGGTATTGTSAFGGGTTTSGGSSFGGTAFSFKPKETTPATNINGGIGFGAFASPVANAVENATIKHVDDDGMEDDSETTVTNTAVNSMSFGGFGLGCAPNPLNANKNPFASATPSSTNNANSWLFGNKPAQQNFFGAKPATTSAFGGGSGTTTTSAFGGGIAFGAGNNSSFGGAFAQNKSAFGSAFGGSASPFAQNTNKPSTFGGATGATTMGSGFASFANKSGGFGALAQQATPPKPNSFGGTSAFSQQSKSNTFNAWRS